jgi:predicted DNA-binding transcriptional regulator AlpA
MNAERAAAYLGISTSKLLEMVGSGEAPGAVDIGGCPRWDRRTLEEWMDSRTGYSKTKRPSGRKTVDEMLEGRRGGDQAGLREHVQGSPRKATASLPPW